MSNSNILISEAKAGLGAKVRRRFAPDFYAQGRMWKLAALQHAARAASRGRISPTRFFVGKLFLLTVSQ